MIVSKIVSVIWEIHKYVEYSTSYLEKVVAKKSRIKFEELASFRDVGGNTRNNNHLINLSVGRVERETLVFGQSNNEDCDVKLRFERYHDAQLILVEQIIIVYS